MFLLAFCTLLDETRIRTIFPFFISIRPVATLRLSMQEKFKKGFLVTLQAVRSQHCLESPLKKQLLLSCFLSES